MTPVSARVTAWVEEIAELLPEARRGFMEDRAPEAAGFLIDATPRLLAVVRGVAELAGELDELSELNDQRATEHAEAGRAEDSQYRSGRSISYAQSAARIRALLADAAPDTEEGR